MFRDIKEFHNKPRHNYNFESTDLLDFNYNVENFMAIYEGTLLNHDVALLDSASIHTILTKAEFFHIQSEKSWSYCKILAMAKTAP